MWGHPVSWAGQCRGLQKGHTRPPSHVLSRDLCQGAEGVVCGGGRLCSHVCVTPHGARFVPGSCVAWACHPASLGLGFPALKSRGRYSRLPGGPRGSREGVRGQLAICYKRGRDCTSVYSSPRASVPPGDPLGGGRRAWAPTGRGGRGRELFAPENLGRTWLAACEALSKEQRKGLCWELRPRRHRLDTRAPREAVPLL